MYALADFKFSLKNLIVNVPVPFRYLISAVWFIALLVSSFPVYRNVSLSFLEVIDSLLINNRTMLEKIVETSKDNCTT